MLSIGPKNAVVFFLFISSINTIPGSPVLHAFATISSNTSFAFIFLTFWLLCGLIKSYSSSFITLFMKKSSTATEMLKFWSTSSLLFAVMNSMMSGWSYFIIPMFAPLLFPPCFSISVVMSNIFMKLIGPDAAPLVLFTMSPLGLICENEKPVPPPDWCISAVFFTESNISGSESGTGNTKHADNCPSGAPAFISVGVFGRKSSCDNIW